MSEGARLARMIERLSRGVVLEREDAERIVNALEPCLATRPFNLVLDEDAPDPCDAEVWSWAIFSTEAVDPYWIRCTRLGPHDRHEDSNTGATWTDEE
jgi:hypothetical protein